MHRLNLHVGLVGLVVAIVGLAGIGCNRGPDGAGLVTDAVAYPWEGELGPGTDLGSTVAMVIDSNYLTEVDAWESYTLDTSRVTIKITDPSPAAKPNWDADVVVTPRSVFNIGPTRTSKRHAFQPGFWFTVVLFDLPGEDDLGWDPVDPGGDPEEAIALLQLRVDGVDYGYRQSRFRIMGNKGRPDPLPNPLADETIGGQEDFQASLEQQRMIRLRGKRGEGKFSESQEDIGGLEFDIQYDTNCLDIVHAYPSSDASNATAIVGPPDYPEANPRKVHVIMVDPKGIDLAFLHWTVYPGTVDQTLAGQGPMLDLAGYGTAGGVDGCDIADPANFEISNLLVTDIHGAELIREPDVVLVDTTDSPDSDAIFRMYAVDVAYAAPQ